MTPGDMPPLSQTVPAVPASVHELRVAVTRFAKMAGVSGELLDQLRLAVSEAVTNVVLHAYVGDDEPGPVHLAARVRADTIEVTVADDGRGMVPRVDSPGLGLGLPLIAQTTDTFDVHQSAGGGTEMRMSFRRDA